MQLGYKRKCDHNHYKHIIRFIIKTYIQFASDVL